MKSLEVMKSLAIAKNMKIFLEDFYLTFCKFRRTSADAK